MTCSKLYDIKFKHSVFALYDSIESFSDYEDLLKVLHTADNGEAVTIYLNSPGGSCAIGTSIISAMKGSNAAIHCIVEAPCYSMASLIALSGTSLEFMSNTYLMFHHYSTMYYGKGAEIELQHEIEYEHFNRQLKAVCMPFLTQKECEKIIRGEDLYIENTDPLLEKRIKRHFKVGA